MADFAQPTLTSTYSDFVSFFKARDDSAIKWLDATTDTNLPSGAKRWNNTNSYFEKFDGSAWSPLAAKYMINVDLLDGCTVNDAGTTTTDLWTANKITTQLGNKLDSSAYTASDVLTKIKTVDGSGSGLDADLLDGMNAATAGTANTIVARDNFADITARVFNGYLFGVASGVLGTPITATPTISLPNGADYIHITGTATITSFGTTGYVGTKKTLIFDSVCTIVHNSLSLICPAFNDIQIVVGTIIEIVAESGSNWRIVSMLHPSVSFAEIGFLTGLSGNIQTSLMAKAPLASPVFTGSPTAPTKDFNDNSTKLATTGYIDRVVNGGFIRQTVQFASVDSSGYANFISIGTGLSVNIAATTTNIKLNASGGLSDRNATINANTTIPSLAANTTNYLYADISASGVVTLGSTTLAPIYQFGGTHSVTNNQFTFSIEDMTSYLGNGSTASQTYRVFLGEAVAGASTVTSVVNYALNGQYVSPVAALPAVATRTAYSANIGTNFVDTKITAINVISDLGFTTGMKLTTFMLSNGTFMTNAMPNIEDKNTISFTSGGSSYSALNRTTGSQTNLTIASWNSQITVKRSF